MRIHVSRHLKERVFDRHRTPLNHGGTGDVFERSMSINAKFLPRLQAAVEQNALLRIGWTGSGEEVPKNGEIGLCPAMPEGAESVR